MRWGNRRPSTSSLPTPSCMIVQVIEFDLLVLSSSPRWKHPRGSNCASLNASWRWNSDGRTSLGLTPPCQHPLRYESLRFRSRYRLSAGSKSWISTMCQNIRRCPTHGATLEPYSHLAKMSKLTGFTIAWPQNSISSAKERPSRS